MTPENGGTFTQVCTIRMPITLHAHLKDKAGELNQSLNKYVIDAAILHSGWERNGLLRTNKKKPEPAANTSV